LEIATDLRQLGLGLQATRLLGLNHLARAEYPAAIQLLGAVTDHQDADPAPAALRRRVTYIETYGWLAFALAASGDFPRALAVADRAVALAAAAEHPLTRTLASAARAYPLLVKGDFAAALPACEEGGRLSRSTGFLAWVPGAYHMWGWALVHLGRQDEGLAYLREATELHEQLELLFQRSLVFFARAEGLFLSGRLPEAGDTARRTLDLARAVGERYGEALARHLLARIAAASDPAAIDSALEGLGGAQRLAEEIGAGPLVARCRLSRGDLLAGAGRRLEAEGELGAAASMFMAMEMSFWLAQAQASLSALR
jgi:tetratricopeptide (TPR) repeat protein